MAKLKRNQLNNIMFPMVDPTDFASIESAITASDFNSGIVAKFYGVTHGNSTAFTSGTISKAALLVHSGVFQQTLKATETNFDFLIVRFSGHASMADQILMFEMVTSDDSDIVSLISDVNSNLLSYLAGLSAVLSDVLSLISDVDSQLLLTASDVDSLVSILSNLDSNFQSRVPEVVANFSQLSDAHSDLRSLVSGITASVGASDMSDIASRVWATTEGVRVDSRILVIQSNVSEVDSQVNLLATSDYLSQVHSDLYSAIGAIAATVTASDMSDIASRVWATTEGTRVDSRILVLQSMVSDVDSQVLLNASMISDTQSAVDSQALLALSNFSDIMSNIDAVVATITASDMSDIASRVWATTEGVRVDSRILVLQSLVSDVESQVDLLVTSDYLSAVHSDLASAIGAVAATVTASDMSDIASRVWATAEGARVDSRVFVLQSMVSDVDSQVDLLATSNYLSQVHSDLVSAIGGITASVSASDISDIASAVVDALASDFSDLQSQISDAHSDLRSLMSTAGGAVTASDISDIASAVEVILASVMSDTLSAAQEGNSRALVTQSLISDIDSQLLLTHSLLSDVESQVDLLATSDYLSAVHSDLVSAIGAITAGIDASDISDIASAVEAVLASDLSDAISAAREGSSRALLNQSAISDVESQLDVTHSLLSDVESQVDLLATSDYLSAVHSDLASAIGAITVSLTDSDISDITSGILAGLAVTVFPTGAIDWDYVVTDSVTLLPISGVEVWVSTDNPAVNIIWKGTTDAFGMARDVLENVPALDAGTYFFWRQRSGYTFDNPDTEVVA